MLKRLALLLVFVLAAVPVAAAATAEYKPEQRRLKPADVKLAKRVALKRADLGQSWRPAPLGGSSSDDADFAACPEFDLDLSAYTITGRASSAFQNARGSSVLSSVDVFPSKAQAAADFTATVTHAAFLACVRSAFERGLTAEPDPEFTFAVGEPQPLSAGRLGQQTFAFRIVTKVAVDGVSIDVFFDTIYVQKGRTIAGLMFVTALEPFPSETVIARKLVARMR